MFLNIGKRFGWLVTLALWPVVGFGQARIIQHPQVTYKDDPPFNDTLKTCGQFNLNVSLSPAQCADDPAFTHRDTIRFTIPCPTIATATETEATDQPSGTQAIYPSLLLAVAAIIPLLKWQN